MARPAALALPAAMAMLHRPFDAVRTMHDRPLWTPDPAIACRAADLRLLRGGGRGGPAGFRRLRRAACLVGRGAGRLLGPRLGFLRRRSARRARGASRTARSMRGDALLPGCAAEFRREPACGARRRRRRSSSAARTRSSAGCSWDELRALVSRLQQAMRARGHRRRRPRRRDAAEHAGGDRRHARRRLARRDLVLLLAGFRRARRARPLRPDRAEALLRRATAIGTTARRSRSRRKLEGDRRAAAERRDGRRRPLSRRAPKRWRQRLPRGDDARRLHRRLRGRRRSRFERLPFDHPLYILFSSGTTGAPKCIVHGAGGTLLQHLKEHRLHCSLKPGDRLFYFTTCGWMMWNWLVSGLAIGRDAAAL